MKHGGTLLKDTSALRLVRSDNYFPNGKGDIIQLGGGVLGLGVVEKFLVAVVVCVFTRIIGLDNSVTGPHYPSSDLRRIMLALNSLLLQMERTSSEENSR